MITEPILNWTVVLIIEIVLLGFFVVCTVRKKQEVRKKIFGIIRITLILLLGFIVNLRPQTIHYNMEVEMKNIDVLFVVDSTMSMWGEDMTNNATRMSAVQKDCKYIIEELNGGNFGLVRFDNKSQILAPFTQDADTVNDALLTIKPPSRFYAKGTSLNAAYDAMEELLISSSKKEHRQTIVFFISDGEITDNSTIKDYSALGQYVDGGAVLGYGTLLGGEMPDTGYELSYHKLIDQSTGKPALTFIDEGNLGTIANDLDIPYIHMTDTANVEYLIQAIKTGSSISITSKDAIVYDDVYFYFVIPLLILIIAELFIMVRYRHL